MFLTQARVLPIIARLILIFKVKKKKKGSLTSVSDFFFISGRPWSHYLGAFDISEGNRLGLIVKKLIGIPWSHPCSLSLKGGTGPLWTGRQRSCLHSGLSPVH